jgi:hypothetical protein
MTRVAYAVPRRLVALLAAVAATAGVMALRAPFPGRFLLGVVAVAATAEALRSALLRPTLRADENGIEVVAGLRRRHLPWADVESVTTLAPPSEGGMLRRRANALEIDLGDRLVLVPAYRLGVSGETAASELATIRTGPY